jgi:Uncharacterized protein conserved in bacteria
MKTLFWRSLVVVFVILGFIGALLPGMPTTVFLILAAWAASKGWPQMDAWLLNHPKYGPNLTRLARKWHSPTQSKMVCIDHDVCEWSDYAFYISTDCRQYIH